VTAGEAAHPTPSIGAWVLLAVLLAYATAVHYGVGPRPAGAAPRWYDPRGFFFDWEILTPLLKGPFRAIAGLGGPAAALAVGVAVGGRSALAAALAFACAIAVALFAFYGVQADFVWRFFQWRGSAVIATTALAAGLAAAAPLLAASWLRLSWPWRIAVYVPFLFAALAFLCNATGTDPSLRFAISPWPAVPLFGLDLGGGFAAIAFAGAALGTAALARARTRSGVAAVALGGGGVALGLALAVLLVHVASAAGFLPFRSGRRTLAGTGLGTALLLAAVVAFRGSGGRAALSRRARHLAVGALLIALPLVAGHVRARADYRTTRDLRAQAIIDALQAYYGRERIYPDTLQELVASGDLASVPKPRFGFGFLYDADFEYQSFGTGYVLEFPAPGWVQCAYNPPWVDDEEDGDAEGEDARSLGGAWSCPSEPPQLW
jgi:hypothetical protein